jgi:hypothetical protein
MVVVFHPQDTREILMKIKISRNYTACPFSLTKKMARKVSGLFARLHNCDGDSVTILACSLGESLCQLQRTSPLCLQSRHASGQKQQQAVTDAIRIVVAFCACIGRTHSTRFCRRVRCQTEEFHYRQEFRRKQNTSFASGPIHTKSSDHMSRM